MRRPTARRAVALLLTLGIVALLGVLATLLVGAMRERLVYRARHEASVTLIELARSGLAAAIAGLAENGAVDGAVHAPRPMSPAALRAATLLAGEQGATLTVAITDESGLFPLRTRDAALATDLFRHLGVPRRQAGELGAELARINATRPPSAPPLTLPELTSRAAFAGVFTDASGAPNARCAAFARLVSEVADQDRPNVNGAPPEVLAFLAESAREPANAPWCAPTRGVFRGAEAWVRAGAPDTVAARVSFAASTLKIRATASRAGFSRSLVCIVRVRGGALRAETPVEAE